MSAAAVATVHIAGEPVGMEQRCARCGRVLVDYAADPRALREQLVVDSHVTEARPFFFRTGGALVETAAGLGSFDLARASHTGGDPLCPFTPAT